MKYVDAKVVFQEIPDEITLAISISGCTIHCAGCHSKYLWDDIGELLTIDSLKQLIEKNSGITCVCFMGGDSSPLLIAKFAYFIKNKRLLSRETKDVSWRRRRDSNSRAGFPTYALSRGASSPT